MAVHCEFYSEILSQNRSDERAIFLILKFCIAAVEFGSNYIDFRSLILSIGRAFIHPDFSIR